MPRESPEPDLTPAEVQQLKADEKLYDASFKESRQVVEKLKPFGIQPFYLPQQTTEPPASKMTIPILTTELETLKKKKHVIVMTNKWGNHLGRLMHYERRLDGDKFEDGTVLGLTKCVQDLAGETPGLVFLNAGEIKWHLDKSRGAIEDEYLQVERVRKTNIPLKERQEDPTLEDKALLPFVDDLHQTPEQHFQTAIDWLMGELEKPKVSVIAFGAGEGFIDRWIIDRAFKKRDHRDFFHAVSGIAWIFPPKPDKPKHDGSILGEVVQNLYSKDLKVFRHIPLRIEDKKAKEVWTPVLDWLVEKAENFVERDPV